MAQLVYLLCSIMSFICAYLLGKAYWKSRTRLLFYSSWCFVGIAINNILLSVDFNLGPNYDLSFYRAIASFTAVTILLYGLIWDMV